MVLVARSASRLRPCLTMVALFGVIACGCGQSDLPKTHPARGKVVSRSGQQLAGGTVQFQPVQDTQVSIVGEIGPDGTFTLSTHKGKQTISGAVEGKYHVTVLPLSPPDRFVAPIHLPGVYTVTAGENTFTLDLDQKHP